MKFIFLIRPFFSSLPKRQNKNLKILRTKRAFKMKQDEFLIIFKKACIKGNKSIFGRCESDFKDSKTRKIQITFILWSKYSFVSNLYK